MNLKEYHRKWYQKNKTKKDAQNRAWRRKNSKRQVFLSRRWYLKHRKEHCARSVENARKRKKTTTGLRAARIYAKGYRKRRQEYFRKQYRKWRRKNPARQKELMRRHLYGIEPEKFNSLLQKQRGLCAICSTKMWRVCIDHCHATKKIRGLLCGNCNTGLGMFKDSKKALLKASKYIS